MVFPGSGKLTVELEMFMHFSREGECHEERTRPLFRRSDRLRACQPEDAFVVRVEGKVSEQTRRCATRLSRFRRQLVKMSLTLPAPSPSVPRPLSAFVRLPCPGTRAFPLTWQCYLPPRVSSSKRLGRGGIRSPWAAVWDKIQNAYYYHNTETNETTWVRPSASAVEEKRVVEDGVTPKISQEKNPTQDENIENVSHTALDSDPASQAPSASASGAVDMRPSTLVWWSDAGDVWNGESLSGLLLGYGPRRYRNLGGGYYMITLDSGPEWAAAAVAALGQGVADPVAEARVDWICCTASAPGYGLFLRWAGDDDEQKLFDVPDELFDDPPPDPAVAVAVAVDGDTASHTIASAEAEAAREEAEAAREEEEANAAAAAAVAATEAAEAAGSEAAAKAVAKVPASASLPKKRKTNKGSGTGTSSVGSISKKRKGAASLIDKWKAVASTAGEEAEREAERQEKMERWKARAAALDPDNPNFMPLGRKRR